MNNKRNTDNKDNITGVVMNANRGHNVDYKTTNEQRSTEVDNKIPAYGINNNSGGGTTIKKNARPLTYKERRYVEQRVKGMTQTQAVATVYDVKNGVAERTLKNMAQRIEHRPAVLAILTEHAERAEQMLVELAQTTTEYSKSGTKEGAMYASTAERTLNSMLDRVHGKAKQSIEMQSNSVTISIDMTGNGTKTEQN